jgi:hypothetical protein
VLKTSTRGGPVRSRCQNLEGAKIDFKPLFWNTTALKSYSVCCGNNEGNQSFRNPLNYDCGVDSGTHSVYTSTRDNFTNVEREAVRLSLLLKLVRVSFT